MADGRGWFPGQGGWQENEGPEDLAALRRTNRMIDAIAADLPVATSDSDEYAVAMMLAAWREDVGREPMPAKPTLGQARNALRDRGGRSRMLATTVGSAAAVTLLFGGFGAAVYQSHPGDALYGLRTSLFGAPPACVPIRWCCRRRPNSLRWKSLFPKEIGKKRSSNWGWPPRASTRSATLGRRPSWPAACSRRKSGSTPRIRRRRYRRRW